jgi:hypothetical protein
VLANNRYTTGQNGGDDTVGLLDGHKGGRPAKLTEDLVDSGIEIAAVEPLTLEGNFSITLGKTALFEFIFL